MNRPLEKLEKCRAVFINLPGFTLSGITDYLTNILINQIVAG